MSIIKSSISDLIIRLKEPVRDKVKTNFISRNGISSFNTAKFHTIADVVNAFDWASSPEGFAYWEKIYFDLNKYGNNSFYIDMGFGNSIPTVFLWTKSEENLKYLLYKKYNIIPEHKIKLLALCFNLEYDSKGFCKSYNNGDLNSMHWNGIMTYHNKGRFYGRIAIHSENGVKVIFRTIIPKGVTRKLSKELKKAIESYETYIE